jgi:acyl-coenzyme A synthetase/AMP-(fatty) acid ligase
MPHHPLEFNTRVQLIPHSFDYYARVKPNAIYAEYTVSPISYEHGYRPITYKDFANAVNGLAWWLIETLGPGNGEVLAYMGFNDVRYPALIIAAVKAGYCVCISPLPCQAHARERVIYLLYKI